MSVFDTMLDMLGITNYYIYIITPSPGDSRLEMFTILRGRKKKHKNSDSGSHFYIFSPSQKKVTAEVPG